MLYGFIRALATLLLRHFHRIAPPSDPHGVLSGRGPVIFVSNHPNGLVDAGLLFVLVRRRLTFLAKAPMFRYPVLGSVLRAVGALAVFRTQDDPSKLAQNRGLLGACLQALRHGGALTMFPEGISHSQPRLIELKAGTARIALEAHRQGIPVTLVPVGLNYDDKATYRSRFRMDLGAPIEVGTWVQQREATSAEQVRALTARLTEALREVSVYREAPELLPRVEAADAPWRTWVRLLAMAAGLPLFLLGLALFCVPYALPGLAVRAVKPNKDDESTAKMVVMLALAPLWWGLSCVLGASVAGWAGFFAALLGTVPLALFTRLYFERAIRPAWIALSSTPSTKPSVSPSGNS